VACLMMFGCTGKVHAQQPAAASGGGTHPLHEFDVVSVRENRSGGSHEYGPTADGYRMVNGTLAVAILNAYVPEAGGAALFSPNLAGLPDWAKTAHFDIVGKVRAEDLAAWQDPVQQPALLREMMQAVLADRFKLAVHRETKEVPLYWLVVAKGGPKFKPSTDAPHPHGRKIPGYGGEIVPEAGDTVHLYEATMAAFAPLISEFAGRPVQDKTGLTGRYDFVVRKPAEQNLAAGAAVRDSDASIFSVLEDIGLKLVRAKGTVEMLVVDRAEPPGEN